MAKLERIRQLLVEALQEIKDLEDLSNKSNVSMMKEIQAPVKYTLYEDLVLELSGDKQAHKEALQLIKDLLEGNHMRAIFFEDMQKALRINNRFNVFIKEFEKLDALAILKDINYTKSPILIFGVYSINISNSLIISMKDFTAFERYITSTASNAFTLSSAISAGNESPKNKLVLLY